MKFTVFDIEIFSRDLRSLRDLKEELGRKGFVLEDRDYQLDGKYNSIGQLYPQPRSFEEGMSSFLEAVELAIFPPAVEIILDAGFEGEDSIDFDNLPTHFLPNEEQWERLRKVGVLYKISYYHMVEPDRFKLHTKVFR